jgi:uncharacterized protein
MPILDCHSHAFPDHVAPGAMRSLVAEAKWRPVTAYHDGTIRGLLASMDRAGIGRTIMCSVATRPGQVGKITDWSASVATERIIPFASIHPDFAEPEKEVERIASLGLRGLKFHPQYMNCAIDDPRTVRIAHAAAANGLAMVFHGGYDLAFEKDDLGGPRQTLNLHRAVPKLRILACHVGGWERWQESLEYIAGEEIYIETSFCLGGQCPAEILGRILERHSPTHLLFGTDSPWTDQAEELRQFRGLAIADATKTAAMWENGMRFLGMSPRD